MSKLMSIVQCSVYIIVYIIIRIEFEAVKGLKNYSTFPSAPNLFINIFCSITILVYYKEAI